MPADLSKSLVHINERNIITGNLVANVVVPVGATVASTTVTGVKVGDIVRAQPTALTDVVTGQFVTNSYVTAADTVGVVFGGSGTSATKSYTFQVFSRGF